ncbi:uncharacterized protein LOC127731798 [Mytilus californianus]|uniref:uncharacterized protein LOC127731798 n=1 Tax=Mytilus californianus TaxID=6549 RepID=UPI0022472A4A|nr:uncharacterized protein LOC127731798 [Mytilus californianus]
MKKGVKLLKNQFTGQMKDVKKYKIESKAAKKGGQSKVRKQMPEVFEVPQEKAIEPQENEKLVGEYVMNLDDMEQAPQQYECRTIRQEWVIALKKRLRQSRSPPSGLTLPVLMDPTKCKSPDEFKNSDTQLGDYKLFLLGGNHLIQAMKELKDEGINISSEINVNLYAGLTPEEARSVGNRHNFMMTTLPVTFQQKVEQTRKFYKEGITGGDLVKKIKKIIQETEETKELSEDSCSTIVSVATYTETVYLKYQKLVKIHEQKSGCDKNISQRLFRALQGCSESNKLEFLSKALEDGLKITAMHVEKARARESIKKVFQQNLAIASWEEIIKKYPDAGEELERFVGKNKIIDLIIIEHIQSFE